MRPSGSGSLVFLIKQLQHFNKCDRSLDQKTLTLFNLSNIRLLNCINSFLTYFSSTIKIVICKLGESVWTLITLFIPIMKKISSPCHSFTITSQFSPNILKKYWKRLVKRTSLKSHRVLACASRIWSKRKRIWKRLRNFGKTMDWVKDGLA